MKIKLLLIFLFFAMAATSQEIIDPYKLPLVPHKPTVQGVNRNNQISSAVVFVEGLKIILADTTFKVIQFDVVYDCHSRSMIDFDTKRYLGNKVDPNDEYFRKRVLAGDLMDIVNTVIERNGVRYRMKGFSFVVTN